MWPVQQDAAMTQAATCFGRPALIDWTAIDKGLPPFLLIGVTL
jgi:hypothetical protein